MKLQKIDESFLDNIKETILIPTGLYGKDDLAIFDSLSGQLSDGMWENSSRMTKFWHYMDFVLDENDQVMIRVPRNYQWYFGWEASPQWFKTWIANHLKQLVKEYIKYNDGEWSRDCTTRFEGWFHKPTPEIKDVYRVYDKLLGRKDRIDKYNYLEDYEYNPDEDEKKVDILISWLFDHESLYQDFCKDFDYYYDESTGDEINKPNYEAAIEWLHALGNEQAVADYTNYALRKSKGLFERETFLEDLYSLADDINKVIVDPKEGNVKLSNVEWNTWEELADTLPEEFYIKVDEDILSIEDKEEFEDEIYDYILSETGFMMESFDAQNIDKDNIIESEQLNENTTPDYNVIKIFSIGNTIHPEKSDSIYRTKYQDPVSGYAPADRLCLYNSKRGVRVGIGSSAFYPVTIFFTSQQECKNFVDKYFKQISSNGADWATREYAQGIVSYKARLSDFDRERGLTKLETSLGTCYVQEWRINDDWYRQMDNEAHNNQEDTFLESSAKLTDMNNLENKIREILKTDDYHDGKPHLFEIDGYDKNYIEHFDDGDVDFNKLTVYERTPEELEEGKCVATFMVCGGKNGPGDWADYLSKFEETFKELEEATGCHPLLYKLNTDILDDVWTGYVFMYSYPKENESLTESIHTLLKEGCWGMPNTLAEVNKLKELMSRPVDAFEVGDCPNHNDELGIGDDELFDRIADYRHKHKYGSKEAKDVRKVIQDFIKDEVLPHFDEYTYAQEEGNHDGEKWEDGVKEVFQEIANMKLTEDKNTFKEYFDKLNNLKTREEVIDYLKSSNDWPDGVYHACEAGALTNSEYEKLFDKLDKVCDKFKVEFDGDEVADPDTFVEGVEDKDHLSVDDLVELTTLIKNISNLSRDIRYDYWEKIFNRSNFEEVKTIVSDIDSESYNKVIEELGNTIDNLKPGESIDIGYSDHLDVYNGFEIVCAENLLDGYNEHFQTESLKKYYNDLKYMIATRNENKYKNHKPRYIKLMRIKSIPQDELFLEDIEKHAELNPKLFDGEELRPEVKETVQKIAKEFLDELANDGIKFDLKDIILIGSNVSYNYNKDSDLDIHLIADSSNLECPDNLYPLLYSAYRSMFNHNYDIKIKGIPAEIYVEMDECNAMSNGIYSIKDGWVKKPVQQKVPDLDREAFDKLFTEWEDRYFDLIGENSKENLNESSDDSNNNLGIDSDELEDRLSELDLRYGDEIDFVQFNDDNTVEITYSYYNEDTGWAWRTDTEIEDFSDNPEDLHYLKTGEDLNEKEEIIESLDRRFDVTDTSWEDGISDVTKAEALSFIKDNANKSTYNWFVKHFDEIEKDGYLSNGNIDVEMLDEEPDSIVEDLHPDVDLGWLGKGKRCLVDADTFTTKKNGDTITVHVSDDLPDLEYEVKDGYYMDDEAIADRTSLSDTLADYEPTKQSRQEFNKEVVNLVQDAVKAEIIDTIKPEFKSEPNYIYMGGRSDAVPISVHLNATNKRRIPAMYKDSKDSIVESTKSLSEENGEKFEVLEPELVLKAQEIIDTLPSKQELIENGAETAWVPLSTPEKHADKGLYVVKNNNNGNLYIGKASDFEDRRKAHFMGREDDSPLLHSEIKGLRKKYNNTEEADKAVADNYSWCRLITLNDSDDLLRRICEYKAISEKYQTCRSVDDTDDYNHDKGGLGGSIFSYIKDSKRVYNEIAKMLHAGKSEPEIINTLNNSKYYRDRGYKLKIGSTVSDMNKSPSHYREVVDDYDKFINSDENKFRSSKDSKANLSIRSTTNDPDSSVAIYKLKNNRYRFFPSKTALYAYLHPMDKNPKNHIDRLNNVPNVTFIPWRDVENRFKDSKTGEYLTRDYWRLLNSFKEGKPITREVAEKLLILAGLETKDSLALKNKRRLQRRKWRN